LRHFVFGLHLANSERSHCFVWLFKFPNV